MSADTQQVSEAAAEKNSVLPRRVSWQGPFTLGARHTFDRNPPLLRFVGGRDAMFITDYGVPWTLLLYVSYRQRF